MTHENYRLIRNIFNDCYNVFYAKWAKKALNDTLSDKDWLLIVEEAQEINKKYNDTFVKNMLVELIGYLEKK